MDHKGIILNKYGAMDVKDIVSLIRRIKRLELIIEKMAGVKELSEDPSLHEALQRSLTINPKVNQLPIDVQKMKELTKVDDYEYQITPEIKKLVKKQK